MPKLNTLPLLVSVLFFCLPFRAMALFPPVLTSPPDADTGQRQSLYLKTDIYPWYDYQFQVDEDSNFTNPQNFFDDVFSTLVGPLKRGTLYYWRARLIDGSDTGTWSGHRRFTTAAVPVMYGSGTISISGPGNYFACYRNTDPDYELQVDTNGNFNSPVFKSYHLNPIGNDSWVEKLETDLYFGATYYARYRSWNGSDTSGWSDPRIITVITKLEPTFPNNGYTGATNMSFKWPSYYNIPLTHEIEIDTSPQFNTSRYYTQTEDTVFTADGFLVKNLDYATKYYWRARYRHTKDTSEWSDVRDFTTSSYANKGIAVYNDGHPEFTIVPSSIYYADYYEYLMDTVADFSSPYAHTDTCVERDTIRNALFGKTYYFRARPIHQKDTGEWGRDRSVTVRDYVSLSTPYYRDTLVNVWPRFRWSDVNGILGYQLQYDTTLDFNSSMLVDTSLAPSLTQWYPNTLLHFNQVYYVRIRCWTDTDTCEWVSFFPDRWFRTVARPKLYKPWNGPLIPTGADPILTWDSLSNVRDYRVQLDTTMDFNSPLLIDQTTLQAGYELPVSELKFGQTYYWRVSGITSEDTSEWSDIWNFRVSDKPRLDYPKNKAVNVSPGGSLDWASISGTSGYILQMSRDSLFAGTDEYSKLVSNPFFHYFDNDPRKFDSTYFWRVKVFHNSDTSDWSDTWKFTIRSRVAPVLDSPADGAVQVPVNTSIVWKKDNIASSYKYQVAKDSLFTNLVYDNATLGTWYSLSLAPKTTYYWRIRSRNSSGNEVNDWSEVWKFTTDEGFPAVVLKSPADKSIHQQTTSVTLVWNAVSGASYEVQLSQNDQFISPFVKNVSTTSAVFTNLLNNTTYYWRVQAKSGQAAGEWSEAWEFTVQKPNGIDNPENMLVVYPVPARDEVHVEGVSPTSDVRIYDSRGVEMNCPAEWESNRLTLDCSRLSPGIYMLRCSDEQGTRYLKIQIKSE